MQQGVLKQYAHACDRDYMHVQGATSCSVDPAFAWWRRMGGSASTPPIVQSDSANLAATQLQQGTLIRTYHEHYSAEKMAAVRVARVGVMNYMDDGIFGFLGKRGASTLAGKKALYKTYSDFAFHR